MKLALVDVDDTLWDFGTEMVKRMRLLMPEKDIPEEFDDWTGPLEYFESEQDAHNLFHSIHQDQHKFEPYVYAKELLGHLKNTHYIHIASNRKYNTKKSLVKFLTENNLFHDDVFCFKDKTKLFNQFNYDLVIDDSPHVQEAALNLKIPVLTLEFPYNKCVPGTLKFQNLLEIKNHII